MESIKRELERMEHFELQILGCLYQIEHEKPAALRNLEQLAKRIKACNQSLKAKATVVENEIKALKRDNVKLTNQNQEMGKRLESIQKEKDQLDAIVNSSFTEDDDAALKDIVDNK